MDCATRKMMLPMRMCFVDSNMFGRDELAFGRLVELGFGRDEPSLNEPAFSRARD